MTINVKLGDKNQNSYVTVAQANSYFTNRRDDTEWDNLTSTQKEQVLIQSAKDLNIYNFIEDKYYESQPLAFPLTTHENKTGNPGTPITNKSFRSSNLYSSTYGKWPENYWKYGTVHITSGTPIWDTRTIASSNHLNGSITISSTFSSTPLASAGFRIFAPIDQNIRDAQCEHAIYILQNSSRSTLLDYKNMGANVVRIGDVTVEFREGSISKMVISPVARKLLSRWIRRSIRIGRG